jgi:WD40 repeat protein/serine/threonine protein kinase
MAGVEEFLRNLFLSNLLTTEQWQRARDEADERPANDGSGETASDDVAGRPTVTELAKRLVERGLITAWQAEKLMQGKKAFFLGRYKLLDCIGTGGMGAVFKAVHCELGRVVAVKMLSKEVMNNRQAVARFRKEIQVVAALDHPNIVAAYDAGSDKGVHYLVMEYVEGHDLGYLLKERGPLPIDWSCECIRQAARGLQSAHERGMVHRDIKPTNLLVATDPETGAPRIKILDLGLARFVTETVVGSKDGSITLLGQFLGTPDYISPEQAHDTRSADIRSDLFSLGCTLFRILTGELPFAGESVFEKLEARETGEARHVRSVRGDVPVELDAVIARMLARDPRARYQTPREVVAALAPFARRGRAILPQPAVAGADHHRLLSPEEDSRLDEFLKSLATVETGSLPPASGQATRPFQMPPWRWVAVGGAAVFLVAAFWLWNSMASVRRVATEDRSDRASPTRHRSSEGTKQRARLEELAGRAAAAAGQGVMSPAAQAARADLLSFLRENPAAPEARAARSVIARLNWPLDLLGSSVDRSLTPIQELAPGREHVLVGQFGDARLNFWNSVTAVAASHDGRLLAGASRDGTVQVFDAANGTRLHTIVPPASPAGLTFRPGSSVLAIAGTASPVTLWNAANGAHLATLENALGPMTFEGGGRLIASKTSGNEIGLWSAESGAFLRTFPGQSTGDLQGLIFSHQGQYLGSSAADGSVVLWDVVSGQERHRFAGSQRPLFSLDDTLLAIGVASGDLVLRDTRTGEMRRTLEDGGYPLAFLDGGARLISRRLGRAILWDLSSGDEIRTIIEVPENAVVTTDDQWLAGGDDTFGELRIWPLNGTQARRDLSIAGPVTALAALGDGSTIVVGTRNNVLAAIDAGSGKARASTRGHPGPADLSPDNRLLARLDGSDVTVVEVTTDEPVVTIAANAADLESLTFSPDGRLLAGFGGWGFFKTSLRLWDASSGRELFLAGNPPGTVQSLTFSADGSRLALAGDSRLVTVWDTARLELQQSLDDFSDRVIALAFHPDGRHLAVACQDRTVAVWDVQTGSRSTVLSREAGARHLIYSRDGQLLAGSGEHRVIVWRTDRPRNASVLATGDSNPQSLAFDPAGQSLIAAGDDGSLRIWTDLVRSADRAEPDETIKIGPPHGIVRRVIWSIDGRHLVTANGDGTVYVLRDARAAP